jgi:hypothetical protein
MFIRLDHAETYNRFLQMDGTSTMDKERQALLYVIAGCRELGDRVNYFYDFDERVVRPESFAEVDLSGGTRSLLELAFNLFNNYSCRTVVDLFASMDGKNKRLAVEGIKIRFGMI